MNPELPPNIKISESAEKDRVLAIRAEKFLKERAHDLENEVSRIIETEEIGEGRAAIVFPLEIPDSPCNLCVKIWRNKPLRDVAEGTLSLVEYKKIQTNAPEQEFDMQDDLYAKGVSVARPISYGKIGDRDTMTMERISGYTLREIVDAGARVSVPWKELEREIVRLKNAGIVHRDLGPQNIMLETEETLLSGATLSGKLRIIDFGLSKYLSGSSPEEEDYETVVTDDTGDHRIHFPSDIDLANDLKPTKPGSPFLS